VAIWLDFLDFRIGKCYKKLTSIMKLRELRVRRLLSIRELARKARVSTSTIYTIETGKSVPRLSVVKKLTETLEVSPEEVDEFREAMARALGESL
jgi:predicted transcriptional regulator